MSQPICPVDLRHAGIVMSAAGEGKPIQRRSLHRSPQDNPWTDVDSPEWNWTCYEYRVKPVAPIPFPEIKELWIATTNRGMITNNVVCRTLAEAERQTCQAILHVKVVDVIERTSDDRE